MPNPVVFSIACWITVQRHPQTSALSLRCVPERAKGDDHVVSLGVIAY